MDAHVNNEIQYLIAGDTTHSRLVHLVIPDVYLKSYGLDVSNLLVGKDVNVIYQVRKHINGYCSEWKSVCCRYECRGAIASVLIPRISKHPNVFTGTNIDSGGLFISATINCDENGRVDPFDVIVFRIPYVSGTNVQFPRYRDIVFYYDELVFEETRYIADVNRIPILCAQLNTYISEHQRSLGDWSSLIRSKTDAILRKNRQLIYTETNTCKATSLDVEQILSHPKSFDSQENSDAMDDATSDSFIKSLLIRASEAVGQSIPVGIVNSKRHNASNKYKNSVVSGLKQGALAYTKDTHRRRSDNITNELGSTTVGLESPGHNRLVGGTTDVRAIIDRTTCTFDTEFALEDVLIYDGSTKGPESLMDLFDDAFVTLAGEDSVSNLWRRRPISIISRRNLSTGHIFYIVSYDVSCALGGRLKGTTTKAKSPSKKLALECSRAGVSSPTQLSQDVLERISQEYPNMQSVLLPNRLTRDKSQRGMHTGTEYLESKGKPSFHSFFSISSEIELLLKFASVCSKALVASISNEVRKEPKLRQTILYQTTEKDESRLEIIAGRIPLILEACIQAITNEQSPSFYDSAVATAFLSFLVKEYYKNTHKYPYKVRRNYYWYSTGHEAHEPAGKYRSFEGDQSRLNAYKQKYMIFDYYSTSGECIKTSKRPIPIIINSTVPMHNIRAQPRIAFISDAEYANKSIYAEDSGYCKFPDWFSTLPREAICERYLPGESYAYVCIGLDVNLDIIVAFPGGFTMKTNAAQYLDISDDDATLIMERVFLYQ